MYARAVDDAAERLRDLRREAWHALGLAAVALGLAVAATALRPSLALPLFVGGLGLTVLGVRALWRRWDLVEWLVGDRDAYAIPEVYVFATREDDSRKAAHVRHVDPEPTGGAAARVRGAYLCVVSGA